MDNRLAHEESSFINFRRYVPDPKEHGYRWVDIKQLRFSAESVDDRGLLASLIGTSSSGMTMQVVECCRRDSGTVRIGFG
ncbi:hypothetical protein OHU25_41030 [Streptomyces sp. NBC_00117]|uniref:hypothetical protein n=1 Tax=Streptomyces sp. NBC_00117 TaxID=2975657 RepID=UPI0032505702